MTQGHHPTWRCIIRESGPHDKPAPAPGTHRRPQNSIAHPHSNRRKDPPSNPTKTPIQVKGSGQGVGSLGKGTIGGGKAGKPQGVAKTKAPVAGSKAQKNANCGAISKQEARTRRAVRRS